MFCRVGVNEVREFEKDDLARDEQEEKKIGCICKDLKEKRTRKVENKVGYFPREEE